MPPPLLLLITLECDKLLLLSKIDEEATELKDDSRGNLGVYIGEIHYSFSLAMLEISKWSMPCHERQRAYFQPSGL
jgi:hypothetical protein